MSEHGVMSHDRETIGDRLTSIERAILQLDANQDRIIEQMQSVADQLMEILNPMTERMLGLAQGVDHLTEETQRAIDHFVWGGGAPGAEGAESP